MIRSLEELHKKGVRNVLNRIFLEMTILNVMYKEYNFSGVAANYAQRTVINSGFHQHKISSTYLYNFLVYITKLSEFELSKNDKILLRRTRLDIQEYVRMLRKLSTGAAVIGEMDRFIRKIMKELYIEDNSLRAFARLSINWNRLSIREKKVLVDKLKKYSTINNRRSILTSSLYELDSEVKIRHEESKNIRPSGNRPDEKLGVDNKEDSLYKDTKKDDSINWKGLGVGFLGGYLLSKYLNREKPE